MGEATHVHPIFHSYSMRSLSGKLSGQRSSWKLTIFLDPVWCNLSVIFWPSTRPKMPFKVMHRKEVTHSNGSYERKSRGRKLADEMGRGKKIPWYSHRLTHQKRVTSELHDSYFRLMTIKHAISKIKWAIKWAFNYYIAQSRQNSSEWAVAGELETERTRCARESHTRPRGAEGTPMEFGVKLLQFLFGLQLPLTCKPWVTLFEPLQ